MSPRRSPGVALAVARRWTTSPLTVEALGRRGVSQRAEPPAAAGAVAVDAHRGRHHAPALVSSLHASRAALLDRNDDSDFGRLRDLLDPEGTPLAPRAPPLATESLATGAA